MILTQGDLWCEYDRPAEVRKHHLALSWCLSTSGNLIGAYTKRGVVVYPITGSYDFQTNCWTIHAFGNVTESCT